MYTYVCVYIYIYMCMCVSTNVAHNVCKGVCTRRIQSRDFRTTYGKPGYSCCCVRGSPVRMGTYLKSGRKNP